jgi:multiple sugar transport system permease protein
VIVSTRPKTARTFQYVALAGYMLFLAFPLLWMLSLAFKGPRELVELHPGLVPHAPTFDNFRQAFDQSGFLRSAWNSFKVAILTSLLTTCVGLPAAYVLARHKGWISRLGLGWILLSQMFPLILIIIPLFLLLRKLHLTDSHAGLVFVYMVWTLPFILWMLQSYVRGIPRDLEEAAMVDGAGRFTVLRTVIAPLLAPGIVVTALFAFISAWNEFFLALVLFTIIQRWLTRGLLSGAVKG